MNALSQCKTTSITGREQADVDAPGDTSQSSHQVPHLDRLHKGKVDQADQGPEPPAGRQERHELGLGLGHHLVPPDGREVERRSVVLAAARKAAHQEHHAVLGAVRPVGHGHLDRVEEDGEHERVDRRSDRLVQNQLDNGVLHVELRHRLNQLSRLGGAVEGLLILGRGSGDGLGGRNDLLGGRKG